MNWKKVATQSNADLLLCRRLLVQSITCNLRWTNSKKTLHMLIYAHQCSSWLAPMLQLCIKVRKLCVERIMSSIVCPITKFASANNNFANLCLANIFFWSCISSSKVKCNSKVTQNHLNPASTHPPFLKGRKALGLKLIRWEIRPAQLWHHLPVAEWPTKRVD